MSLLADFGAGMFGSLESTMEDNRKRRLDMLERAKLAAMARADRDRERELDRKDAEAAAKHGEGFNPKTGRVEWIKADGTTGSRVASAAEIRAHEMALAAAEQQGVLADLNRRKAEADIVLARARAARANRANLGGGTGASSGREDTPKTSTSDQALAALRVANVRDLVEGSVDQELYYMMVAGQIGRDEVDDMRAVLRNKRRADQAAIDNVTSLLPPTPLPLR